MRCTPSILFFALRFGIELFHFVVLCVRRWFCYCKYSIFYFGVKVFHHQNTKIIPTKCTYKSISHFGKLLLKPNGRKCLKRSFLWAMQRYIGLVSIQSVFGATFSAPVENLFPNEIFAYESVESHFRLSLKEANSINSNIFFILVVAVELWVMRAPSTHTWWPFSWDSSMNYEIEMQTKNSGFNK